MDYDKIKYHVFLIFEQCSITNLPFNCFNVLSQKGYQCVKYSQLPENKFQACMELSPDSCTIGSTIYYNDKKSYRRIRFSLMHELGHIELQTENETEANIFSSNILCPSIALYYSKLNNIREISNLFDISLECAKYAKDSYEKWFFSIKTYGATDIDRKIYQHFYKEDIRKFVFKETQCIYCDALIYNSNKPLCAKCNKPLSDSSIFSSHSPEVVAEENFWLYHDL